MQCPPLPPSARNRRGGEELSVSVPEDGTGFPEQPRCVTPRDDYGVLHTNMVAAGYPLGTPAGTPAPLGRFEDRPVIDVIPPAPRKKPPSANYNIQGMSASASRCRERLAAASRPDRWQIGGAHDPDGPVPMDENSPQVLHLGTPALERSETGPRKRLDESLDDADMGDAYLVTPKKMRGAEELLSQLHL